MIKSVFAAAPVVAVAALGGSASAAPNGTRPTILTNLAVTSVNSTQMRVSGKLTTLSGAVIAGMRVEVYAAYEASFVRWAIAYTNGTGDFSVTTSKTPSGTTVQIEVEGNGAYSRPLPTFNRP